MKVIDGTGGRYAADADGNIYSRLRDRWRKLRPFRDSRGRMKVTLSGSRGNTMVHRIIAETFLGPRPTGAVVRHLNGDIEDNRAANLAYGTQQENVDDMLLHGTRCFGERNPRSKLSEAEVRFIRGLAASGAFSFRQIARAFGMEHKAISNIASRRTWGHI